MVFVDLRPPEKRCPSALRLLKRAEIVVVHDTKSTKEGHLLGKIINCFYRISTYYFKLFKMMALSSTTMKDGMAIEECSMIKMNLALPLYR